MRIKLHEGKVKGHLAGHDILFEKLVENSFSEWSDSESISQEKLAWSLVFKVKYGEGKEEFFYVDTDDEYLSYLDLEGYIQGQMIELDDESELKIVSKSSYIYELICFSEILKFDVLEAKKIEILERQIFPEWANGIVADDLADNEIVSQFMKAFAPVLEELGIVKRVFVDIDKFKIEAETDEVKEKFERFIEEYIGKKVFFLIHNPLHAELYPETYDKVFEIAKNFFPDRYLH